MMNKPIVIYFFTAILLTGCNFETRNDNQTMQNGESDFQYLPLNEYKYAHADIKPGTALQVIDFSGGKQSTDNTIYYCQFLVINKTSGDTIKILAPLITTPPVEKDYPNTYTTPVLYNPAKGITTATYTVMDSTQNWALQPVEKMMDTSAQAHLSTSKPDALELVVFNKTKPVFRDAHYKTVTGILNFNGIPW